MNLSYVQNIWKLSILLLLMFSYKKSNSFELTDLKRTCLYYFPFEIVDESYAEVNPPNEFCTAVATYNKTHPPRDGMDIIAFKRGLPYVYIYDFYSYNDLKFAINPDNIQVLVLDLNSVTTLRSIDVLVINFFNNENDELEQFDEDFQNDLTSLCDKIRVNRTNMLIGLKLHRNAAVVKSALNVDKAKTNFDFFIISSYDYNPCLYNENRALMASHPTPSELTKSVDDLKNIGFDEKKMFLTINVYVISFKKSKAQPEYWSHTWMCQSKAGDKRRFCRSTLENIYERSKVVFDRGLAGVVVEATDCDDYRNTCGCTKWPATQCICDGIEGREKNKYLMGCKMFGLLPNEYP